MVTVTLVGVAAELAAKITEAEHVGLQLGGLKIEAPTPDGRPEMLKFTDSDVPVRRVVATVSVPPLPLTNRVRLGGGAIRELSKGAVTTTTKIAVGVTF